MFFEFSNFLSNIFKITALKRDLLPSHKLQDNSRNRTGDVKTQPEFMQLIKDNENLKLELERVQTENEALKVERSEPLEFDNLQVRQLKPGGEIKVWFVDTIANRVQGYTVL